MTELDNFKQQIRFKFDRGFSRAQLAEFVSSISSNGFEDQLFKFMESLYKNISKAQYRCTDLGNAERLVDHYGTIIHFCYEREKWLVWNGRVWEWDSGCIVADLAKKTIRQIYHEAANEDDKDRREALWKHASSSESNQKIKALLSLTQSEPGIPIKINDVDTNPWYFNCYNGTIDLRTGELLPHKKDSMQSIIVGIEYAKDAECPRWMKFLQTVTGGNQELQAYLQRAVGYSITGDTKSQVLFFLWGLGCNGKSTFVATIRKLAGEYGERVNTDLFMMKDKSAGGPKEGLANLRGKRLVVASELEDGKRLAVSLIKDMTGGESIKADRKYEHEIEYLPTHKLWLVGNHKPVISDTTLSIWRRMKLVPFTVTIPHRDIDPDLPQKLETELPGILAWAVRGSIDWLKNGLGEPEAVTVATSNYRHEQDVLGDFLEDCCVLDPIVSISKTELSTEYGSWCQTQSISAISQKSFKNKLTERGVTDYKGSGGKRFWQGIRLKTNDEKVAAENTQKVKTPESIVAGQNDKLATSGRLWQEIPENHITRADKQEFMENPPFPATCHKPATINYPLHPCSAVENGKVCGNDEWEFSDDGTHYSCFFGHRHEGDCDECKKQ